MKLLSWNCRGLGNPRTVRELHQLVKEKSPQVVFLSETKCNRERVEMVRNRLGFVNSFVVNSLGRSGGLAMIWNENLNASLFSYSRHHISLMIKSEEEGREWHLTGFYGDPALERRKNCWDILCLLRPDRTCPWLCMGDFNELVSNEEKMGGAERPFFQMESFREALDECELGDLGYVGSSFTWCNKREWRDFIKERLDRVLGNSAWQSLFDSTIVNVLPVENLDHTPLLVSCFNQQDELYAHKRLFRYEAFWSKKQESKDIIQRAWAVVSGGQNRLQNVQKALKNCMQQLQAWAKSSRGNHQHLV
ncbi:uncharacterized protein LOC122276878 [Carya illinoinensis]|uniref:uncharacterized protein LOC122276878 n=1 Tax=Carya illinoinensis TaxID=32201 RepID=UPI001C71D104|nr:uncharacterized protein LOC122276878 [Carya illinoinensis]